MEIEDDRPGWTYEDGGPPVEISVKFVAWLKNPARIMSDGQALTTKDSWPDWKAMVTSPTPNHVRMVRELAGPHPRVAYPRFDLARVYWPVPPLGVTGNFQIEEGQAYRVNVVILFREDAYPLLNWWDAEWKVHFIGPAAQLGDPISA